MTDDIARAISEFSVAIYQNRKDAAAYVGRGLACDQQEDYNKAIEDFTREIQINPSDRKG